MYCDMKKKVIDENGKVYATLAEAFKAMGVKNISGKVYHILDRNGVLHSHGKTFRYEEPQTNGKVDPIVDKLKRRYTHEELEQIARGEGIQKKFIPFPEIRLDGSHHRAVVISDTHIGSVYSPEEWHDTVAAFVNDPSNKVDCVLHCGDIVEGLKIGRAGTQIYELTDIGFESQKDKAVALMRKYERPIYIISGNHDMYFKEFAGADIVKAIANEVPNMTYVGHDSADIDFDGCKVRLFHGGDGNSYALSYRLQKLVESYSGGSKPNILLAGHVHKFCYILERNIHAVSVPCMQAQTSFMRGKKLAAHTGFLVLDFDTANGEVRNLSVKMYPFYA